LCEQYRSLSSSICSFLHSPVSSSLLGPNILLIALLLNSTRRHYHLRPVCLSVCTKHVSSNWTDFPGILYCLQLWRFWHIFEIWLNSGSSYRRPPVFVLSCCYLILFSERYEPSLEKKLGLPLSNVFDCKPPAALPCYLYTASAIPIIPVAFVEMLNDLAEISANLTFRENRSLLHTFPYLFYFKSGGLYSYQCG